MGKIITGEGGEDYHRRGEGRPPRPPGSTTDGGFETIVTVYSFRYIQSSCNGEKR